MPVSQKDDVVGDVEADLDLVGIPPEVQEYAREKLGETPDTRVRTIQELRDMIYERGEVTPVRMDDAYLLRFLRSRSFKVEAAYKLLVNYGLLRENNPEWWAVNPLQLSFIGESDVVSVLPYRTQTGHRTLIYKIGKWNPNDYPIDDIFKATIAILELGMLEPRAQILGGYVIWDLAGLSLNHAWHITPSVASKVVEIMMTSFPMKVSAIHIVNESWVFDMVFNMFKPLLGRRYREIMFFHGEDRESLHAHIDAKYLPTTYGGTRPEYSYREWFEALSKNSGIITEMKSIGYNQYGGNKEKDSDEASEVLSTTSSDSS